MKLLFVHERFGAFAGAEVNLFLTASALKELGHTVGILHGSGTDKAESQWRDLFPERSGLAERNNSNIVNAALYRFEPDVIYVHKMTNLEVLSALVDSSKPLVRMVHDHDLYCMRSYKYHPLTQKICRRPASPYCVFPCGAALMPNRSGGFPIRWVSYLDKRTEIKLNQRFHRMIVATNYMKEELLRNGFDPRRIEIHAPVPRGGDSSLRSSFSERNLIIYAGQIIRGKGVANLLEALKLVRVPFDCVILGDGNYRAFCEKLSRKLGLDDRVHFKGYVPQEELRQYYTDASVAVVSSVWPEPFGAVGLEAMRYGLPVVAFDAGGIKEWLDDGQNGFLVPWMDRVQFATRIEQLLGDKILAQRMGERGRQMLRERFDFERYIDGLEKMFKRVIAEDDASSRGSELSIHSSSALPPPSRRAEEALAAPR